MQLTAAQFKSICPTNKYPDTFVEVLNELLPKYEINTVNRVAGFLAQCGHESNGFSVLKENLNYGAQGLLGLFKKYFPDAGTAKKYERQPEKIANRIYANRMGNGPESSGEGWKFRGRGAIQLTGKDNYSQFAKSIGKTLDDTVAYLETVDGAVESACWFWSKNGLNAICDKDDIVLMTKRINGGTIGLEDRKKHYNHAKHILGENHHHTESVYVATPKPETKPQVVHETVKVGSRGETVKIVQAKLGLTADGVFGPGTEKAVKAWQTKNGLTADGIVGPNTLRKMLG